MLKDLGLALACLGRLFGLLLDRYNFDSRVRRCPCHGLRRSFATFCPLWHIFAWASSMSFWCALHFEWERCLWEVLHLEVATSLVIVQLSVLSVGSRSASMGWISSLCIGQQIGCVGPPWFRSRALWAPGFPCLLCGFIIFAWSISLALASLVGLLVLCQLRSLVAADWLRFGGAWPPSCYLVHSSSWVATSTSWSPTSESAFSLGLHRPALLWVEGRSLSYSFSPVCQRRKPDSPWSSWPEWHKLRLPVLT